MPNPPRKRGRPKGPPKQKKPPSKIGRPSPWSKPADRQMNVKVPEHVQRVWRISEFKTLVDKLAIDFERSNCDNKRVESREGGAHSPPAETIDY